MRIGLIACANGLGHIKRIVKIANRLAKHIPNARLTLYCEPWQVKSLEDWSGYRYFCTRPDAQVVPVSIPMQWSPLSSYYSGWLMEWSKVISDWELSRFDYILSDNLVEPLLYSGKVILIGSFLWHDILSTAFPDNPAVQRYRKWAEETLKEHPPDMIVNQYFAMPATEQQTKTFNVGIIGFCQAGQSERDRPVPQNVLIAVGSSMAADECFERVVKAAQGLNKIGARVFCSSRWHGVLSRYGNNVETYDFDSGEFDKVDLAIVRAGIGTISDCITAKVPMLYVEEPNPETEFNRQRLSQLGIGAPLKDFLDGKPSPLNNSRVYRSMLDQMGNFSLKGDVEAADFLANKWGDN
jgi:hypothetical protein